MGSMSGELPTSHHPLEMLNVLEELAEFLVDKEVAVLKVSCTGSQAQLCHLFTVRSRVTALALSCSCSW